MPNFQPTELILKPDGSIYHLNLLPGDVAQNIILVGDPGRVPQVSAFFDQVNIKKTNREFLTHTGLYKGMPISVISTGIGTDNIDIVVNELDALFNINLENKQEKNHKTNLRITRIGTCGALQRDIDPGTPILSDFALGLDNLAQFYDFPVFTEEEHLQQKIKTHFENNGIPWPFYVFSGSVTLKEQFRNIGSSGITVTCPGFYGPQGRSIRLQLKQSDFLSILKEFRLKGLTVQNFEMETSALFALSRGLDHDCASVNLTLANRETGQFLKNYQESLNQMIDAVLKAWQQL